MNTNLNARLPPIRTVPLTIAVVANALAALVGIFGVLVLGADLGRDITLLGLAAVILVIQPAVAVLAYQAAGE